MGSSAAAGRVGVSEFVEARITWAAGSAAGIRPTDEGCCSCTRAHLLRRQPGGGRRRFEGIGSGRDGVGCIRCAALRFSLRLAWRRRCVCCLRLTLCGGKRGRRRFERIGAGAGGRDGRSTWRPPIAPAVVPLTARAAVVRTDRRRYGRRLRAVAAVVVMARLAAVHSDRRPACATCVGERPDAPSAGAGTGTRRRQIRRCIERSRRSFRRRDAPDAIETLGPIRIGEVIEPHGAARRRRVHEAQLAHVDADMRMRPARRVEENQVAGGNFVGFNRFTAHAHVRGRARQVHRCRPIHHIAHEPAAIETCLRRIAAPAIRHAHERHRLDGNFLASDAVIDEIREAGGCGEGAIGRGSVRCSRRTRHPRRRAGARGNEEGEEQQ